MNERLTIQDLTDLLANKHSMTKKDAEAFVKEFFLLIEEALENENYVKIKGLGTFKLIEVDNRESVNINTGERFQIKGHTKVSFTPDTNLRDSINKPFAHFETVVLNDNTILEDTPVDDVDGEEDEITEEIPVQIVEKVGEIKPEIVKETIIEEMLPEVEEPKNIPESAQEEVIADNEYIEEAEELIEIAVEEKQPEPESEKQEVPIEHVPLLTAEQIIAQELRNGRLKPDLPKEQSEDAVTESVINDNSRKEKSPVPYLIAIIVVVVLLCAGTVTFIYYPDLFSFSSNKGTIDMPTTTQTVQPEVQLSDTIEDKNTRAEATTAISDETTEPARPVAKKEMEASTSVSSSKQINKENRSQAPVQVYSDSAEYTITGTKGTHTIVAGESLIKVSLRYYGTKSMWSYIVKHNQGVIKNPDNVPYGTTIKIPELKKK